MILHRFKGSPKDGGGPFAGIVFDNKGNIYGTTSSGGEYGAPGGGWGTVYELVVPIGTHKNYEEKVLWNFNWSDGGGPVSSLILDSGGNLYGTTSGADRATERRCVRSDSRRMLVNSRTLTSQVRDKGVRYSNRTVGSTLPRPTQLGRGFEFITNEP